MIDTNPNNDLAVVILAAGKGKRMTSDLPKPLIEICGKPMITYLIETLTKLSPKQIIIVYSGALDGFQKALETCKNDKVTWVEQPEQLGTGHAALYALPYISASQTMFLCADTPLIEQETLQSLIDSSTKSVGILTTTPKDPTGFGRIVRDQNYKFEKVVEEKDVTCTEKEINEVATGVIIAPTSFLATNLNKIANDNAQKEYYLPDIIPMWLSKHKDVTIIKTKLYKTTLGANNPTELAALEKYQQQRIMKKLLLSGVNIINPDTVNIQGDLTIEPGATIEAGAVFKGKVVVRKGATIGYHSIIQNATIGENANILPSSIITGASIAANVTIGPFAHIRPNTHVKEHAKIGSFVEVKSSTIGAYTKANHLAYIGNAEVGEKVNIGAGTVTCNYDGVSKFKTVIEDEAFIGSGSYLIAPITIGKRSYIGAGSCITKSTPPKKLTFSRSKQVTLSGWANPITAEKTE